MATLRTSDAPALQASLDPLPAVVLPEKMETQRLRGTQRCLRWPILLVVGLIITLEMLSYVILRVLVHLWEKISRRFTRSRKLKQRMATAQTFEEWCKCARELDVLEKREQWKRDPVSAYYDHPTLQRLQKDIRQKREKNDMKGLMRTLRTVYCKGNVAGIDSEEMYSQTHWGTKYLIHDFIKEVLEATILLRDTTEVDELTKLKFFRKIKRSYGRTALLLSGGASFGYYHLGVIKTLFEANCLPKVISGTSAGSMIAALVGVRKDDELRNLFRPEVCQYFTACEEPFWVKLKRFIKHGALFDPEKWAEKMQIAAMGNITFEEAYRRTGRILNITTTPLSKYVQPLLLNHITAPNVIIWSAVLASCAVPSVLTPVELLEKDENGVIRPFHMHGNRFSDGSIKHDVPVADVAEKHNVNYFIVSQVNPHVVLFVYDAHGSSGEPSPHRFGSRLRGGFVSATLENLLKLEMRKWLQLIGNLDLLPLVLGQDWRYLFTQVSSGTVSIYPKPALRDYLGLLTDPDYEAMERFLILSERNTWPKLSRISNHFIFESTLRACERFLTHRMRDRAKVGVPKQMSDKLQVTSNGNSKAGRKSPVRPPAPSPSNTDVSSVALEDDSDDQTDEKQRHGPTANGSRAERTDLRTLLNSGGDWEDTAESGDESESGEGLLFNWDSRPNGEPAAEIGDADQGSEEDGRSSEDLEPSRVDLSAVAETVKSRGRSRQRPTNQQRVGSSSV